MPLDQLLSDGCSQLQWSVCDTAAYEESNLVEVPAGKIVSVIDAVTRRTPAKINSFKYFVRDIVTIPDPRNRAWHRKQLERIVRRIRDNAVGRADYSMGDFAEDVKRACSRESITFDNEIFNELAV